MKRFLMFLLVVGGLVLYMSTGLVAASADKLDSYTYYTDEGGMDGTTVSPPKEKPYLAYLVHLQGAKQTGETVRFVGTEEEGREILARLAGKVVAAQQLDGLSVIYAYSAKIGNYVELFGERVNLQLAVRGGVVTVGTPLIKGSY